MPDHEIFTPSEYERVYPDGIERHYWNIARNELIYGLLAPHIEPGDLVMDVGCGTGITVAYLRARGVNIRGVERGAASVTRELDSIVSTETDLFMLDDAIKQDIKAILLLDVLEHIGERQSFLMKLAKQLPNCKVMILTVPARMELWSSYDEHWGHYLRYNLENLRHELKVGQWTTHKSFYFFNWIYVASFLVGKLGVKRGLDFQPIARGGLITVLHRILGFLTKLESRIMPGFVPGSSIACVAFPDGEGLAPRKEV
jgi:SAM-dependent methyltransferase